MTTIAKGIGYLVGGLAALVLFLAVGGAFVAITGGLLYGTLWAGRAMFSAGDLGSYAAGGLLVLLWITWLDKLWCKE